MKLMKRQFLLPAQDDWVTHSGTYFHAWNYDKLLEYLKLLRRLLMNFAKPVNEITECTSPTQEG